MRVNVLSYYSYIVKDARKCFIVRYVCRCYIVKDARKCFKLLLLRCKTCASMFCGMHVLSLPI